MFVCQYFPAVKGRAIEFEVVKEAIQMDPFVKGIENA